MITYHPTILRYVQLKDSYQRGRISPDEVIRRLMSSFDNPVAIDDIDWAIFGRACLETKFPIEDVEFCLAEVYDNESWEGYEDLEEALLSICHRQLLPHKPLEEYL